MLRAAVLVLGIAVLLGVALLVEILRRSPAPPPRILATVHGLFGLGGFGLTLAALTGPPRGSATGTKSFGLVAAVLLFLAALVGLASLVLHVRKRRMIGFAAGAHASIAIFGYVILAVYLIAG